MGRLSDLTQSLRPSRSYLSGLVNLKGSERTMASLSMKRAVKPDLDMTPPHQYLQYLSQAGSAAMPTETAAEETSFRSSRRAPVVPCVTILPCDSASPQPASWARRQLEVCEAVTLGQLLSPGAVVVDEARHACVPEHDARLLVLGHEEQVIPDAGSSREEVKVGVDLTHLVVGPCARQRSVLVLKKSLRWSTALALARAEPGTAGVVLPAHDRCAVLVLKLAASFTAHTFECGKHDLLLWRSEGR